MTLTQKCDLREGSNKMKNIINKLIISRLENCYIQPWWMKRAYYDYMRREIVMVAFPLNYIVSLAWWLNLRWGEFRHKPTWLDAIIKQRAETRIVTGDTRNLDQEANKQAACRDRMRNMAEETEVCACGGELITERHYNKSVSSWDGYAEFKRAAGMDIACSWVTCCSKCSSHTPACWSAESSRAYFLQLQIFLKACDLRIKILSKEK